MTVDQMTPPVGIDLKIFPFDHDHGVPARELKDLLGGKGSGLAEMTSSLGLAVPPGFTIPLTVSRTVSLHGWPQGLDELLDENMRVLGERMNRHFGDTRDPLLVAVRSGAPESMPGMLDTVLNLGLNDETVRGLVRVSGDPVFAWDSYRRFVQMFAVTVLGFPAEEIPACANHDTVQGLRAQVAAIRAAVRDRTGGDIPHAPAEQLRKAVHAVFESWDSPRAKAYRTKEGIAEDMGTAVNVQVMVFGNRGSSSGTGVVFTRNPSTGEPGAYGDYLPKAQGEDVVAGTAHTLHIDRLADIAPSAHEELLQALRRMEVHFRDMCDVEFTIEDGKLWLLQVRTGKRGATASVRIAADFVEDPDIRLRHAEAVARVPEHIRAKAREEVIARARQHVSADDLLTVGLGASPGRVSGTVVLTSEDALDADADVILVRPHTSPEDVAGMGVSAGILTSTGGLVSHAAVVARGWHLPAVVGAGEIGFGDGAITVRDRVVHAGDTITIDGTTGEVWIGAHEQSDDELNVDALLEAELPELLLLEHWAAQSAAD